MKKLTLNTSISILFLILFSLASCAEPSKNDKTEATENDSTIVEQEVEINEPETQEVSFMLPSPIQIAAMFSQAGLSFKEGLINDPSNVNKYNTKTSKYLNFGVYSADLAYLVLTNKQQQTINQLNAVKTMSEGIGMSSVFSSGDIFKSFEANLGNQDTILRLLTTIKRRTDAYLEENRQTAKDAIFFSAAWVEGMYLGAKSADDQSKIMPKIIEQMGILKNVINAIENQNDPTLELTFMIDGLKRINQIFNAFPAVINQLKSGSDLTEIILSNEEMAKLTTEIESLRNEIVAG